MRERRKGVRSLMAIGLCACMLAGCTSSQETDNKNALKIRESVIEWYLGDAQSKQELPVYFISDDSDVPYIDMDSAASFMELLYSNPGKNNYKLTIENDGDKCTLTRENDYYMEVDCKTDTITFSDYDMFIKRDDSANLLDPLRMNIVDGEGNPSLFQRQEGSFERYGKTVTFDLATYDIDLVCENGKYYIPLQTFSDLLGSPLNAFFLYNGKNVIITTNINALPGSELGDIYYAEQPTRSRSQILYNYSELCFFLDNFYGLKEQHNIDNFSIFFTDTGLAYKLVSEDAAEANAAIAELTLKFFTDKHSNFNISSCYAGEKAFNEYDETYGQSFNDHIKEKTYYSTARSNYYKDGPVGYEEVGNTAYITFDGFIVNPARDYYTDPGNESDAKSASDTVALVQYAHKQIMRENSPIENVVIDLTCNGGGTFDAALYISAWCLGEARVDMRNTLTDAEVSNLYRVDVNLDREFDENDTIASKNIFCMTSPASFSCGNLVPAIFKNSGRVTLIGKKSGGGACTVYSATDADGTGFNISGPYRLSVLWNGAYYDIDQGIVPDAYIAKTDTMYNRQLLNEFVNGIK